MKLILHQGKIREKLSNRGYYISQLGLIQEDKENEYCLGDIRTPSGIRRLIIGKEEVIVSEEIVEGRTRLIQILQYDKIPFRKAKS